MAKKQHPMKGKSMQPVRFQNIESMLAYLPEDQLEIVDQLRNMILETIPGVKEKLSFQVPFYSKHSTICLIWPGAVPWGTKTRDGVELAFNKGYLLNDPYGYLEKGSRKQIFNRRFFNTDDIQESIIRQLLLDAAELDLMLHQEKRLRKR